MKRLTLVHLLFTFTSFPALHGRASLKRRRRHDGGDATDVSRPSRAGLIEAPTSRQSQRAAARFPALHGRASLKHARCRPAARRHLGFPALHGRASLKRRALTEAPGESVRFPALHGRASLKPPAPAAAAGRAGRFSRPSRAGLIEACPGRRSGAAAARSFSRPSRAGLIEARLPPEPVVRVATVFPPFTGGPH